MNRLTSLVLISSLVVYAACSTKQEGFNPAQINQLYKAAPEGVKSRWASAENVNAEKGKGGMTNKGAKGDAYTLIAPGTSKVIFNQEGAGMITKIWSANSLVWTPENRRKVKIEMYWDDEEKPAVSVPFTDFFGIGLGLMRPFECELFSAPEGRSHNCFIPMPYRTAARIEVVNESEDIIMFYYKINFVKVKKHADDVLYFHSYWHRDIKTTRGVDFEILPKVEGRGRYLGTNIGVVGDSTYQGTWFGEGEVKIYLDGDTEFPTLVGTGTEDYIGTGWGQGEYAHQIQGSLVSDKEHDIYTFYRYHTIDPVYFHSDCKVTIQQIGNSVRDNLRRMRENRAEFEVVWSYVEKDGLNASKRYLDMDNPPKIEDDNFPNGVSTNFFRSDDVSATAYFYLDKPSNKLHEIQSLEERTQNMKEKVYQFQK
ncbi:glycoside hydrolase family 172 protein [Sunxiuqinia sp. sy24]|uniref:glycoside hydrolase family 172 protein n=1 Tax=Sunxiuqinia sp. sy24 TaxID=3461495 RepID=UPI004045DA9E